MSSVQKLVTDEDVFPTKYGTSARGRLVPGLSADALGKVEAGVGHVCCCRAASSCGCVTFGRLVLW